MIQLRQHVPAFVNDGDGGWTAEAASLADLLALPQVSRYAENTEAVEHTGQVTGLGKSGERVTIQVIHPAPEPRVFHRFSRSDDLLMVEHNGGDHFWVVGRLRADVPGELAALPEWRETETARIKRDAWNHGDTGPTPKRWRCAAHGVEDATCCFA